MISTEGQATWKTYILIQYLRNYDGIGTVEPVFSKNPEGKPDTKRYCNSHTLITFYGLLYGSFNLCLFYRQQKHVRIYIAIFDSFFSLSNSVYSSKTEKRIVRDISNANTETYIYMDKLALTLLFNKMKKKKKKTWYFNEKFLNIIINQWIKQHTCHNRYVANKIVIVFETYYVSWNGFSGGMCVQSIASMCMQNNVK